MANNLLTRLFKGKSKQEIKRVIVPQKHIYLIGADPHPAAKATEIANWIELNHMRTDRKPFDVIFMRYPSRDVRYIAAGVNQDTREYVHDTPIILDEMGILPDPAPCINHRLKTKYPNARRIVHLGRRDQLSLVESEFKKLGNYDIETLVI